jgi:hypothetical protein
MKNTLRYIPSHSVFYIELLAECSSPDFYNLGSRSLADLVGCDSKASTKDLASCLRKVLTGWYKYK